MKKRNKEFVPDFLQIPSLVMHMNPADRFVFGAIYNFCNMALGKCIASNRIISKIARVSEQTVANSLTRLEDEKFIKRVYTDDSKKTRKEIICLIGLAKTVYSTQETSLPPAVINDSSTKEQSIIIENNTTLPVEVFKQEEYLNNVINGKDRLAAIVAIFAKLKKKVFKDKKSANNFLYSGFNLKYAKELKGFEDNEIIKAMKKCDSYIIDGRKVDWSLKAVVNAINK